MSILTMRKALNKVAKGEGQIVWHIENAERNHRLIGAPHKTIEAAMADKRLVEFEGYSPKPYLLAQGIERRWVAGKGYGDYLQAQKVWFITQIQE